MIRMEYPKANLDGLTDAEKIAALKRQVDVLTDNLQIVLDSIEADFETLGLSSSQNGGVTITAGGGAFYGESPTAGNVAAKVATVDSSFKLKTGVVVFIKMAGYNSASTPTLNVNGTGAKEIKRYGVMAPSSTQAGSWYAGSVVAFLYDGTYWQMVGYMNTTYSAMSNGEYQAGTSTTARLITPKTLKEAIQFWTS